MITLITPQIKIKTKKKNMLTVYARCLIKIIILIVILIIQIIKILLLYHSKIIIKSKIIHKHFFINKPLILITNSLLKINNNSFLANNTNLKNQLKKLEKHPKMDSLLLLSLEKCFLNQKIIKMELMSKILMLKTINEIKRL